MPFVDPPRPICFVVNSSLRKNAVPCTLFDLSVIDTRSPVDATNTWHVASLLQSSSDNTLLITLACSVSNTKLRACTADDVLVVIGVRGCIFFGPGGVFLLATSRTF
ncbi:hypothetical protein DIPPA_12619 [Diplonema papillatum]|nr:hypothetical protein DIPPA_12619 [Diplonema papillatum]